MLHDIRISPAQLKAAAAAVEDGENMAYVYLSAENGTLTVSQGDERDVFDPAGVPVLGFLEMVESAWYELTKGELDLVDEGTGKPRTAAAAPEVPLALAMRAEVERFTTTFDVPADDIEEASDRAVAERVAEALRTLWYGPDA